MANDIGYYAVCCKIIFSRSEAKSTQSPINFTGELFNFILSFPIYLIFNHEAEKFVYAKCGVLLCLKS